MEELPSTRCVPVVRADFSDDVVWFLLKRRITAPSDEGFLANVDFVEDRTLIGLEEAALSAAVPRRYPSRYGHPVMFIADTTTMMSAELHLLVLDLRERNTAECYRAVPEMVQAIENNLSISNMDYIEFSRCAGPDGVFRGF